MITSNATSAQVVNERFQNPEALCQKREKRLFRLGSEMLGRGIVRSLRGRAAERHVPFGHLVAAASMRVRIF